MKYFLLTLTLLTVNTAVLASDQPKLNQSINALVSSHIVEYGIPGVVVLIGHSDRNSFHKSWGTMDGVRPMKKDAIFDLASITKVFTAATLLKVLEQNYLDETALVSQLLLDYRRPATNKLSFEDLLRHNSGLRASAGATVFEDGPSRVWENIINIDPAYARGKFRYSDVNYLVLGRTLEVFAGASLENVVRNEILIPLAMKSSSFRPNLNLKDCAQRCAPSRRGAPAGSVHDPVSFRLGGVAGHAGLFTSARDLARFAAMILNSGKHQGEIVLSQKQVKSMTEKKVTSSRGLGFDIDSRFSEKPRGDYFAKGLSFGHTGYSGVSMWIDPTIDTFLIVLANPVYAHDWKKAKKGLLKLIRELANITGRANSRP